MNKEQVEAKREEIQEGVALLIPTDCDNCYLDGSKEIRGACDDLEEPGSPCLLQLFLAKEYLNYLSSLGVMLVDKEIIFPENPYLWHEATIYQRGQQSMKDRQLTYPLVEVSDE